MTLKVIIVGAGRAGSELHLDAYRQIAGIEVIALCDLDIYRAKSIADQKEVPFAYTSLEDALDAQAADIVSICTPPSSHFDLCKLALEHGSHVLVEKPIFQTLDEAEKIKEIIARTGGKFSAVHNQKYKHGIQQAIKLKQDGYIGEVVHIHSVWMVNGNNNQMIADPDFWCHKLPGGRWEEMIAHPIYKAYQFMGPMRFVHLEMKQVHNHWPWLPADEVEILLEGATGYVSIKLSANAEKYNFMLVYGSKRVMYVDGGIATDLFTGIRSGSSLRKLLPERVRNRLLRLIKPKPEPARRDAHAALIEDFVAHIRGERAEAPVDWGEAYNTLELVLQIGKEIQRRK